MSSDLVFQIPDFWTVHAWAFCHVHMLVLCGQTCILVQHLSLNGRSNCAFNHLKICRISINVKTCTQLYCGRSSISSAESCCLWGKLPCEYYIPHPSVYPVWWTFWGFAFKNVLLCFLSLGLTLTFKFVVKMHGILPIFLALTT